MNDSFTLEIDSIAYGGKGIGRLDGKVWFVPDTVPGDRVNVQATSNSGRYGEATVIEFLERSDLRGASLCSYAADCGGCQWMEVDYETQLDWKRQFVVSALKRIGKIDDDHPIEILPSPARYHYRHRVLLRAHLDEQGRFRIGYFRRQSRELVPIHGCHIAAPGINKIIGDLWQTDWHGIPPQKLRLEIQELVPDHQGKNIAVTIYPADGRSPGLDDVVARIAQRPEILWAGLVFDLPQAPIVPFDNQNGLTYLTIPGQFQQVNLLHNHNLRRLVASKIATMDPVQRVLDVFCGSGNLSLALADGSRYVEGVESNKKAIACARRNAEKAGLSNITYIAGDAEKHLWKCARGGERFDLILADPPRQGMYKALVPLKMIAPRDIIYVSCDPSTLARDVGALCRKDTYRIKDIVALDFFPNTYHVETVVHLQRHQGS